MTAKQLHQLAMLRRPVIARFAQQGNGLTLSAFRRWLDQQVEAGLLEKHRGHYALTDEGWAVAAELNDLTVRT